MPEPTIFCHDCEGPNGDHFSGEMMFRYSGWTEAADLVIKGMDGAITAEIVTYDFHRMMESTTNLAFNELGDEVTRHTL